MGKRRRTELRPKEVYSRLMKTQLCQTEERRILFEELRLSMRSHYPTIFGDVPESRMEFFMDEDSTLMLRLKVDESEQESPWEFKVWRILARIPLGQDDQWCLETFLEEMAT